MEELRIDFQTAIILGTYIISIVALYWKIRLDIAGINIQIENIKIDRKEKWDKHEKEACQKWEQYDEKIDKSDAVAEAILKTLSDIKGDVKEMKTNIDWLKKK